MAYKVSYKVVSEQGEQLKKVAKEMDNYVSQLNQIISKLGSDQLLQSVRGDLKKFQQQLETERAVLDMAGGILIEVVHSYSGAEKKSVAKVDKAKAHNRDFYKRPVVVASAGGAAGATAYASGSGGATAINQSVVNNTYNINDPGIGASGATAGFGAAAGVFSESALAGAGEAVGAAAAVGVGAAAGGVVASSINEKRKEKKAERAEKAEKAAKPDD